MYYCCGLTRCGIPAKNEDSFLIGKSVFSEEKEKAYEAVFDAPFCIALADGVGGEQGGETASRTALESLAGFVPGRKGSVEERIRYIHDTVRKLGQKKGLEGMQCTLCSLISGGNALYAVNCGDSRIYLYNCGSIRQISTDHSLTGMLYDGGKLSSAGRESHTHRNLIFSAIGSNCDIPVFSSVMTESGLKNGDLYIMCTDGISGVLSESDICGILDRPEKLSKRLEELADAALEQGSKDNMTVMGLCFA